MQVKMQQLEPDMEQTDWFQIWKGVWQGCILSPGLFNFYAEYIIWNARLDESQARVKIAGRNINNLRYADDTTFMAESEEELMSFLMKVKEESEKVGLKLHTALLYASYCSIILNDSQTKFRKLRSWHPVPSLHGK